MNLTVEKRKIFGKGVKSLRQAGRVPAELYGHGVGNLHLAVDAREFKKVLREAGENMVVYLEIEKERKPVLIHDVQKNYVTNDIQHIDFYEVRMDEKIKAHIPLEFVGEAPAVKEKSGFLNKSLTEVEVEALPGDLPHTLQIALHTLDDLNKSVYVQDIHAPSGVKILLDPRTVVATVVPPVEEEKVEAPVDVGAVKVEAEEKKAERVAEKTKQGAGERTE